MVKASDQVRRLMELHGEKQKLLGQLLRAFLIMELASLSPADMKQRIRTHVRRSHHMTKPWRGCRYVVQVGDSDPLTFDLEEVPLELWPGDLAERWQVEQARKRRRQRQQEERLRHGVSKEKGD